MKTTVSLADRVHFRLMSLVHETLYGLFRNPYEVLEAAGLEPGQTVLEVGCGPGFFTVPAARIVGEQGIVYTLDISPLALDRVTQKVQQEGVTNVRTVLADAAQTGLPGGSFDLIFLFGLNHAVGDMGRILKEQHRLLKPAGILSFEGSLRPPAGMFAPLDRRGRISRFRKLG
jgi:ubiquinone/menaquinone biosynthesis C-methylase UbiE